MKKGFTLVELLVVIAMLMILMGAVTSSVMRAQRRAKIAQATAATQEMTNAILAYENYLKKGARMPSFPSWKDATEGNIGFLIGKAGDSDFGEVPVLFNAALKGGKALDPWGNPYQIKIVESSFRVEDDLLKGSVKIGVQCPSFNRRAAWEVQ